MQEGEELKGEICLNLFLLPYRKSLPEDGAADSGSTALAGRWVLIDQCVLSYRCRRWDMARISAVENPLFGTCTPSWASLSFS
jgi:hypothetical protein